MLRRVRCHAHTRFAATAEMVTQVAVELAFAAQAELGESPVWNDREAVLQWVDIDRGEVHRFDPSSHYDVSLSLGGTVGSAGLARDSRLVVAHGDRFILLDQRTGAQEELSEFRVDGSLVRFNDGKVDPWGSFHAGTMHWDASRSVGALYRLYRDGNVSVVLSGVTCSNGMDWSPGRDRFYYVDSMLGAVQCFRTDPDDGRLLDRIHVFDVPGPGMPDGMCLDREGFLWIAMWDGGEVRRVSVDGELERVVRLPVSKVTSMAFAGANHDELYLTTARQGMSLEQLASEPHAGDLFWCRPGCAGQPAHEFG